jgi:myo-inositol-1(or 4)-monophosphatase
VSQDPLHAWLETCEAAARAGGEQLIAWRGRFQTREKGVCDLVTDADLASQRAIQAVIAECYPDHAFLGEEQTSRAFMNRHDQLAWIVDPLDGTTNYVHGYPHYSVSVALARGSRILVGVIYDPLRDECFAAAEGCGARCNGRRLDTSRTEKIGEALVAVSLPARVRADSPDLLDFVDIVQVCQAVRRSGSAALNLAHVADGALDAFWATHIHPWDVAAGILLIREAGGLVTGRNGAEFDLWNPHFATAGSSQLHAELLRALRPFTPSASAQAAAKAAN